MASQKIILQPAYVLHHRAYRDTSALVELLSPEYGRIGVVAKGVKSVKSRWRGVLQPFQPLLVSWIHRGELGTLTSAEVQGPALNIAPDLITSGFYLNEILMRLLHRDESQLELFGWYDQTLRSMAEISTDKVRRSIELEVLLRKFEMRLLSSLGYGLVLDQEADTDSPLQAEHEYIYQLEHGPVKVNSELTDHSNVNAITGFFNTDVNVEHGTRVSGATLLALRAEDFSDELVRTESKRLLRGLLGHYLGPKPLHSRNLAQSISQHQM